MCYKPLDSFRVLISSFPEHMERWEKFDPENIEFQTKVLERAGIGSESYFPAVSAYCQMHRHPHHELQYCVPNTLSSFHDHQQVRLQKRYPPQPLWHGVQRYVAVLLSNRNRDKKIAKYELKHLVRTHIGAKDVYYKCISLEPDNEGITGVNLSKSLRKLAGEAFKVNVTRVAVLVLPYSEQIKYVVSVPWRRIWAPARKRGPYVPDFKRAFEHFCIHLGGKSVIKTVKEKLKLRERDIERSKMTLYKFGNTSLASTWYSLGYLEAKGRVKKRDRLWQLAFGSGIKCNSAVWRCIRKLEPEDSNVWSDFVHKYPVDPGNYRSFKRIELKLHKKKYVF
ncbi:hypothetical protein TIFTF001_013117 [Ficus carica]|uniref:very-long-chain 3-oxoacyl-CoA synthase n=1 Tax=Ficus carica TaxID=3494 RepID=A0AA88A1C1_FICCA|nr:hypothetical protein TIFTF001_013117 [Ficus carica]